MIITLHKQLTGQLSAQVLHIAYNTIKRYHSLNYHHILAYGTTVLEDVTNRLTREKILKNLISLETAVID